MNSDEAKLKEKLLKAALKLFAERGRDGVSLRDIAAEAGATHGSIRHHFGTKDNLYIAAVTLVDPIEVPVNKSLGTDPISPATAADDLRSFVKWLVSYQARMGVKRHIALGLLQAEVSRDGGPDPVFYKKVIHPGHERMKHIIHLIRPDIEDNEMLEILAFNVIFQCVMVRTGRGIILKRLRKRTLTRSDIDRIAQLIADTTLGGLQGLKP